MKVNGVEVNYCEGNYYEDVNVAAKRYGVPVAVISERLKKKQLFWAKDPNTGVMMVCGALPDWIKKYENEKPAETGGVSVLKALWYLIVCPAKGVVPNILWAVFWIVLCSVLGSCVNGILGMSLLIGVSSVKFVLSLKAAIEWELEHPQDPNKVVYIDGGDYGGDGFFDEVSDRRRADLQFLLGTGPYAK